MPKINYWTVRQTANTKEEALDLAIKELKSYFDISDDEIETEIFQEASSNFFSNIQVAAEVTLTAAARERIDDIEKDEKKNYSDPIKEKYNLFLQQKEISIPEDAIENGDYYVWINNKNLYSIIKYSKFKIANNDNILDTEPDFLFIDYENIVYYEKEGDINYSTEISGGGGGGYSLKGAILGGIFAGGAGAIIGSRKKTNDIVSETRIHDNRRTILYYKRDGGTYNYSMRGYDFFDYLLKSIPEKELMYQKIHGQEVSGSNGEQTDDLKKRLERLKSLYEEGLITENDYNNRRQEILSEI